CNSDSTTSAMFISLLFFFTDPSSTELYTFSLHDALPISTFVEAGNAGLLDAAGRLDLLVGTLLLRRRRRRLFFRYHGGQRASPTDRKSTRLNSSHVAISYAVFCLKKKNENCPGCALPIAG